jgi:N-acyl-D-amino-acid deacylase
MNPASILIRNGTVIDGTGSAAFQADVAVEGGKISEIGNFDNMQAERIIHASGFVVCAGFVEMHSHGDLALA